MNAKLQQESKPRLLKLAEAAAYIGMSPSWLKQHGADIPYVQVSASSKRWSIDDLDQFIAANTRKGK